MSSCCWRSVDWCCCICSRVYSPTFVFLSLRLEEPVGDQDRLWPQLCVEQSTTIRLQDTEAERFSVVGDQFIASSFCGEARQNLDRQFAGNIVFDVLFSAGCTAVINTEDSFLMEDARSGQSTVLGCRRLAKNRRCST